MNEALDEAEEDLDVWLPIKDAAERAEQPRRRVQFWSTPPKGKETGELERRKNEDGVWTVNLHELLEKADGRDKVEKDILPVPAQVWEAQQAMTENYVSAVDRAARAERTVEHLKNQLEERKERERTLEAKLEERSMSWWQKTFGLKSHAVDEPAEQ